MNKSELLAEVSWNDVKDAVKAVNLELYNIIEKIKPAKRHSFVYAKYQYFSKIIEKGQLYLPTKNGLNAIQSPEIPDYIRNQLDYAAIPLALVLKNSNEVYVEIDNRVTPLNFFFPGDLFGIFEWVSQMHNNRAQPQWEVCAGARTVFMLPKITDSIGHRRLRKKYGFKTDVPQYLFEHSEIFSGIDQKTSVNPWYNEILFFSKNWFKDVNDAGLLNLKIFLHKTNEKQMQLLKDILEINLLWASFSKSLSQRNLKPRHYLIDTTKQLVLIACGSGLAFKPAIDNVALPLDIVQNAYAEDYQLKHYNPVIMQPTKLSIDKEPVYYSLSFPAVIESTPVMKNAPSIMDDQRDIKELLKMLDKFLKSEQKNTYNPIINIKFDFYHTDTDVLNEIGSSQEVVACDKRFIQFDETRDFCANAPFFRGCIKISYVV